MARTFDATTELITKATPAVYPGSVGTVAFWLKPAWSSGDSVTHNFVQFHVAGNNDRLTWEKFADNNIYCGWLRVSALNDDRIVLADTGLFTSGSWAHWAFTWSDAANTEELFKNGSSLASRTSDLVTYTLGGSNTIGNQPSAVEDARGDMAHVAVYDTILNTDELGALADGFSPLLVKPSSLISYLTLAGRYTNETDMISGDTYTVTGATRANDRRIVLPTPGYISSDPPPSVASSTVPQNVIWF